MGFLTHPSDFILASTSVAPIRGCRISDTYLAGIALHPAHACSEVVFLVRSCLAEVLMPCSPMAVHEASIVVAQFRMALCGGFDFGRWQIAFPVIAHQMGLGGLLDMGAQLGVFARQHREIFG